MKVRIPYAVFALSLLLSFSHAQVIQPRQTLQSHVRPAVASGQARRLGDLPAAQRMNLSIVLPLRNEADLKNLLDRLYDPSSPDYRQFLSVDEFTARYGPTAEDYQAVVAWAQANGLNVTGMPPNRLIVPISGTVDQVERAFNVRMNVYQHPTENRTFFSPDREPTLDLSVPIAHISGLNNFSLPHANLTRASVALSNAVGSGPNGQYLGSDMRAAYYGGSALTGSGQCVGLFAPDGYYLSDVDLVFNNTGQSYSVPINNVLLDGAPGIPVGGNDQEAVIDIVQAIGMAPGLSQVRVYVGNMYGYYFDDPGMFNAMASENVCKQLSVSWSWSPDDPSTDEPIFQEFAAQGQSIFVASGDTGGYNPGNITYPADDPYVTATGGTDLVTNGAGGPWGSETAWIGSAGGISLDNFAIPGWQTGVTNSSNGASTTLRNIPDVAMEANTDNYNCFMAMCEGFYWGGTSFAAPRWAAFMALVNQQAAENGNSPAGFINPAIYSIGKESGYSSDFHDITSGNNDDVGLPLYYNSVAGYDLVTGWGSPTGQNLINALAGTPSRGFTLTNSALTSQLSIDQGSSGTVAITVNDLGGFSGSVNLAVSGLPSGVTGSFTPSSTKGSSTLYITVANTAAQGKSHVTVTGTSGSRSASTTFALNVVGPSFTLSIPPTNLYISTPNVPQTATVTVTGVDGFAGNVKLSVSGMPSGMTASFSSNPTASSTVLSVSADETITVSGYYLTITGTSGSLSASTALYVVVQNPFFGISASPNPITINAGQSGTSTIAVQTGNGFSGGVNLTVAGLPPGVTASFSPNPATTTSTLTLNVASNAPPGNFPLIINGISGRLKAPVPIRFTLNVVTTKTTPTVTVTPSTQYFPTNQAVSVMVAVSGGPGNPIPTGSVSLSGAGYTSSAALTSGSATFTIPGGTFLFGNTTLTAIYSGDANYPTSSGSGSVLTVRTTPAVSASANPASITSAQLTVVTASVAGYPYPTGLITLTSQGNVVGYGTLANGSASIILAGSALPVGTDTINVNYSGDYDGYTPASGSMSVTVTSPVYGPAYPAQPVADLGAVNLMSTSSTPTAITFNFTAAKSVGSTAVVTQGAQALDFTNAGGGTCDTNGSSHVYNAGDSCTLNVDFTPMYAGARYGAVRLLDTSGNLLATALLYGSGVGPQLVFPTTQGVTTLGGGLVNPAPPVVDAKGNAYVSDSGSVKEIPSGCGSASCVTTLGGGFASPWGLAVDGSGNVYVGDTGNSTVREIPVGCVNSSCVVTLGGGFNSPGSVAVDGSGNVYVSDYSNNALNGAVKEIPPGCTSASCVGALAQVDYPGGVAVDGIGNVYVYVGDIHQIAEVRCVSSCQTGPIYTFNPVVTVDGSGNLYLGAAVDGGGNLYTTSNGIVQRQNLASPPSLTFATTNMGSRSSDSPQTVTLRNIGNAPLTFPVPATGVNPSVSANFTLDGSTTCPEVLSSGSAGTLAAGASCALAVDFIPQTSGSISGSAVLTDNNLNASPAVTQSIGLSGTGAGGSTPLTPWIQVNNGAWQQVASVAVNVGDRVNLAPTNFSGGSWSWSGPNGFTASTREIDAVPLPLPSNVYTVTYTNTSRVNSTQAFTVTVNPTALTPYIQANGGAWQQVASVAVSVGGTANLAPLNISGGSWSWTGPGGFTASTREIDAVPIPSPSNVYTVTYTNTSGVNSTQAFTVTVNPTALTPYIQLNGGAWQQVSTKAANLGDIVNLAPLNISGGSWSWSGPSGFTASTREIDAVQLHSPSNVYTVTYTNTSGVTSTQAFTVTVNSTPVVPYIQVNGGAWQQASTKAVNVGDTVNLAGQQVSGTWSWTGPSGFTSTSREIDAVQLHSPSNVYTLTYTNTAGVTSAGQAFTITVNPTPLTPWMQVNNGAWLQGVSTKAVNVGDRVNLAPTNISGGSWSWTGPGFTASTREIDAVPLNSASNVYTVTYTNTSGVNSSQAFTITINATPVVPYIQVNGGAWQQTASATVSVTATVNLAGQQVSGTWSWTGPSGFTSTSREIDAVPLTTGTNVYTLKYTNVDGVQSSGQAFTITSN